ncbi:hypothetical protein AV521_04920 [Streptomyces sp. IMTB 2501]|uniref:transposase n=1 Tax=Streptomyces sp. IMTB 2501 TaxID=1776340 RepID=UPI00096E82E7|nr:hypothetical protein AV521_04920 [Streptomyces sp. IMTB 2501]
MTSAYSTVLGPLRPRGTGHDPGRVAVDLAVTLANGGESIMELAVLRDQGEVLGPVTSTPTAWRLLTDAEERVPARLRSVCSRARETAWLQAAETSRGTPTARAGGRELPGPIPDIDATLITCHSEKEQATPTYKGGFGYHPCFAFWPVPAKPWRGDCGPGTPERTPPVITQRSWTMPSPRSPAPTDTAPASASVRTAPEAARPSSPTSAACATEE